jgi:hypothetical protein
MEVIFHEITSMPSNQQDFQQIHKVRFFSLKHQLLSTNDDDDEIKTMKQINILYYYLINIIILSS